MHEGIEKLSAALIRQAHHDLGHPCCKVRSTAVAFFEDPSPWVEFVNVSADFMRRRLSGRLSRAAELGELCTDLETMKSGAIRCPFCNKTIREGTKRPGRKRKARSNVA